MHDTNVLTKVDEILAKAAALLVWHDENAGHIVVEHVVVHLSQASGNTNKDNTVINTQTNL